MGNQLTGDGQQVMVHCFFSNWQAVTSGVSQELNLGPMLFNSFVSDLDDGLKCPLINFADDTNRVGKWTLWKVEPACRTTWIGCKGGLSRNL